MHQIERPMVAHVMTQGTNRAKIALCGQRRIGTSNASKPVCFFRSRKSLRERLVPTQIRIEQVDLVTASDQTGS